MGFLGILVQGTWVVVMLSELAAAAIPFPIALPNCPDKCGDVEIPYPFGLTEGCSIDQNFLVNCTNSSGHTQPIMGNLTVTKFSFEGQANVLMYVAKDCYKKGVPDPDLTIWTEAYLGLNFTISNTQNKFIVVGCDTYAFLYFQQDKGNFSTGCVSVCESSSSRYIVNGSCSGAGCCEVDIPTGLNYVTLESHSFNNHTKVGAFNPCGYAFISQQTMFNFSIDYLSLQHPEKMPLVLDWAIGTETCKDVNKSSYKCGGNSTCIDSDNGSGYRCKCMKGYHGNPYLYLGCQGINLWIYTKFLEQI